MKLRIVALGHRMPAWVSAGYADYAKRLPKGIQKFTTKGVYDDEHAHLSFIQGGGHGGSHPHLVHEFVSSIVEGRPSFPDVYQSVNWTLAGVLAHESAMRGGQRIPLPDFRNE